MTQRNPGAFKGCCCKPGVAHRRLQLSDHYSAFSMLSIDSPALVPVFAGSLLRECWVQLFVAYCQIWKSRDTFDSTPAQAVGVFSHEELDISPSYPNTPLLCLENPEGESQVQSHMTAIWIRGEIMTKFSVSNLWTRTTPVGVSICWPNGSRQNVQQSRPSRPPPPSHNVYKFFLSTMSATWTMGLGLHWYQGPPLWHSKSPPLSRARCWKIHAASQYATEG